MADLFGNTPAVHTPSSIAVDPYFTPFWAAEALLERHFSHLTSRDLLLEPTCGDGAFLGAVPASVPAVGVEIDPVNAEAARRNTGRQVICGDFRTVQLDLQPTAVIGNPPFRSSIVQGILDRCHELLPEGAYCGLIMPAFMFQTPSTVLAYAQKWSISTEMLPRTLFKGDGQLSKPLVFALFRKDLRQTMVGFALYREMQDASAMNLRVRHALQRSGKSEWARAIIQIVAKMGGSADLEEVYQMIAPRKPYASTFWKEQVRKVCARHLVRQERGRYALPLAA